MTLILRPFQRSDETAALGARAEFQGSGFDFLTFDFDPAMPWVEWIDLMERYRRGVDLPSGRVRGAILAGDVDGELVGSISIRFALNDYLAFRGGHIGYGVVTGYRRLGYATEMLREGLGVARAEGVESVLLTCDDDNIGSATVIERCGGALESVAVDENGVKFRRYWLAPPS